MRGRKEQSNPQPTRVLHHVSNRFKHLHTLTPLPRGSHTLVDHRRAGSSRSVPYRGPQGEGDGTPLQGRAGEHSGRRVEVEPLSHPLGGSTGAPWADLCQERWGDTCMAHRIGSNTAAMHGTRGSRRRCGQLPRLQPDGVRVHARHACAASGGRGGRGSPCSQGRRLAIVCQKDGLPLPPAPAKGRAQGQGSGGCAGGMQAGAGGKQLAARVRESTSSLRIATVRAGLARCRQGSLQPSSARPHA